MVFSPFHLMPYPKLHELHFSRSCSPKRPFYRHADFVSRFLPRPLGQAFWKQFPGRYAPKRGPVASRHLPENIGHSFFCTNLLSDSVGHLSSYIVLPHKVEYPPSKTRSECTRNGGPALSSETRRVRRNILTEKSKIGPIADGVGVGVHEDSKRRIVREDTEYFVCQTCWKGDGFGIPPVGGRCKNEDFGIRQCGLLDGFGDLVIVIVETRRNVDDVHFFADRPLNGLLPAVSELAGRMEVP